MRPIIQSAFAAVLALAVFQPAHLFAEEAKPAVTEKESAPVALDATGMLIKDGEKIKFKEDGGKTYLVTKNNTEKVLPFVGKKVKLTGKSKSAPGTNGKPFYMVVYVNKIEEVAGAAPKKTP